MRYNEEENKLRQQLREKAAQNLKKFGSVGAIGLVAIFLLFNSFYSINQTERGVHTRFGEIVGIAAPGANFRIPFVEGVRRIPVNTQTVSWSAGERGDSRMSTYSRDQQPARIAVTVTWRVQADDASVQRVATEWGRLDNIYNAVVVPSVTEGLKNVFGTYTAEMAIQQRAQLNAQVVEAIRARVAGLPVVIDTVQIQDIEFSDAYENAVEARMTAQVEVQRAEQERERARINGEQTVITAQAAAERTRLEGEAQASAIRARAAALATSPQLVQLTLAERWNGQLPTTMVPGGGVPMLNLPRSAQGGN